MKRTETMTMDIDIEITYDVQWDASRPTVILSKAIIYHQDLLWCMNENEQQLLKARIENDERKEREAQRADAGLV